MSEAYLRVRDSQSAAGLASYKRVWDAVEGWQNGPVVPRSLAGSLCGYQSSQPARQKYLNCSVVQASVDTGRRTPSVGVARISGA